MRSTILVTTTLFVLWSCANTRLDRYCKRDYNKNIKNEEILISAYYEGVANIQHSLILTKNNKFSYNCFYFGQYDWHTGNWSQNHNSDTIYLTFHRSHSIQNYQPYVLLRCKIDTLTNQRSVPKLVFKKKQQSNQFWYFNISHIDTNSFFIGTEIVEPFSMK